MAPFPGPDSLLALAFPSDPQISHSGQRVAFVLSSSAEEDPQNIDPQWPRPRYRSHIWLSEGGPARPFTQGEGRDTSPRWSPDDQTLAFVREEHGRRGQVYLLPLGGGEARRVTSFKNAVQDVQWSPDGRFLSFLSTADDEDKRDERGEARVITRPRYRFNGRDWLPERAARLWRYDLGAGTLTLWHAPEVEISAYAWLPDASGVLFVSAADELHAAQWQQEVYRLPLGAGAPQPNPQVTGQAIEHGIEQVTTWNSAISAVIPHPDSQRFALVGRPAGSGNTQHAHLYLVDPAGHWQRLDEGHDSPVGNLVGGDCHVGAMPEQPVWLDHQTLLFSATRRGSCGLFQVTLNGPEDGAGGGQVTAHDHQPDAVIAAFTARAGRTALIRERADRFPEVELAGVAVTSLHDRLPFPVRQPQPVAFDNELGQGEGWVLLPAVDAPVPALLNIHGGPHTDYGHAFMHEFQVFAARGYGVCYSNPRGSVGYGQAWVDDIHGRWGSVDMADLLNFFDTCLRQYPQLDAERTAVMGGSYGGFMTNWITAHTTRFQAAITDRSICNLLSFGGTSDIGLKFWDDELGLGVHRRADTLKLWDMSPLQYVQNVQTPTLIVHSVLDHRCPIEQAEQWYAALTLHGVPVRFVRFPEETHELSRSGRPDRRIKRQQEYLDWLERWLGPVA